MIRLDKVSYSVETEDGDKEVIHQVSLDLDENKFYVLTGPNGGGKSSLAKLIMGIYKPKQGRIYFDEEDITDMTISQRAKLGIGYAFQHPPRFKGLTVGKLLELSGWKPGTDPLCTVLKRVGLCPEEYLNRDMDDSLSGGELKRIEIASLLAKNPAFSIFDEPEAGIDLWSFSRLTQTFKDHQSRPESGGLLIISHQERIMELADEILLVAEGEIRQRGTKEDMLAGILSGDDYCDFTCDRAVHYEG